MSAALLAFLGGVFLGAVGGVFVDRLYLGLKCAHEKGEL